MTVEIRLNYLMQVSMQEIKVCDEFLTQINACISHFCCTTSLLLEYMCMLVWQKETDCKTKSVQEWDND